MSAGEQGKVAERFVLEAKRGKAWKYVKCTGGDGECEKLGLSLDHLFIYFLIYFFIMRSFFLGTKGLMQHEVWRKHNL